MPLPLFPVGVSKGAKGGPGFKTFISEADSGHEVRSRRWQSARAVYDVAHLLKNATQYKEIYHLWLTAAGAHKKFLFKDWADFESDGEQTIGTGDGVEGTFQLIKTYTTALGSYVRKITRPVPGTVVVRVDGAIQEEGVDYTVDYDTGILTFAPVPGNGLSVTAEYQFYVPVRFGFDQWPGTIDAYGVFSVPQITLVEVRE